MLRLICIATLYVLASPVLFGVWIFKQWDAHRFRRALQRAWLECPRCGRVPALGDFTCETCGSVYAGHAGLCSVCLATVPVACCPKCGLSLSITGGRDA